MTRAITPSAAHAPALRKAQGIQAGGRAEADGAISNALLERHFRGLTSSERRLSRNDAPARLGRFGRIKFLMQRDLDP